MIEQTAESLWRFSVWVAGSFSVLTQGIFKSQQLPRETLLFNNFTRMLIITVIKHHGGKCIAWQPVALIGSTMCTFVYDCCRFWFMSDNGGRLCSTRISEATIHLRKLCTLILEKWRGFRHNCLTFIFLKFHKIDISVIEFIHKMCELYQTALFFLSELIHSYCELSSSLHRISYTLCDWWKKLDEKQG